MLRFEPLCLSTRSAIFLRLKRLMGRTLLETAVFVGLPLESCVAVVLGSFFARFACACTVRASRGLRWREGFLGGRTSEWLSWCGVMVSNKQVQAVVGHVGIEVSSLSRSRKFYEALLGGLGFKMIMDSEDGVGFSNQRFQVWVGELRESRVRREAPTGEEFVVADHLAILVQDKGTVDAVERRMKKKGFEALFPCEEHPQFEPGYYAVSFCDPDNYVIEIYTRPKPKRF